MVPEQETYALIFRFQQTPISQTTFIPQARRHCPYRLTFPFYDLDMGNSNSSPLETCLNGVFNGIADSVSYPSNILYQFDWVKAYNLNLPVTPAAVTRPHTSEQIAQVIQCAVDNDVKVQARSGGHSYANYGKASRFVTRAEHADTRFKVLVVKMAPS